MCKALAEIMKPEIDMIVEERVNEAVKEVVGKAVDEAVSKAKKLAFDTGFNDGFNDGATDKGIQIFKNMIHRGFSKEDAQSLAEISDELAERALLEC